ncbi:MAG: cytochrome-c peroxidase, partial [Cyanobacteria bacterium P01_A01_bin.105]
MVVAGIGVAQLLSPPSAPTLLSSSQLSSQLSARTTADMLSEPIQPIPELSFDRAEVALGRRLFQDRNLSATGQMSCATCHQLDRAGVDGLPQAVGNGGQLLSLNTPTVFNSGFNFRQNW